MFNTFSSYFCTSKQSLYFKIMRSEPLRLYHSQAETTGRIIIICITVLSLLAVLHIKLYTKLNINQLTRSDLIVN